MRAELVLIVVSTTLIQALVTMSAVLPSAIAPALATTLDVATSLIGYQIAVVYGAAMATSLVGGVAVRRWGACRVSQIALALCGMGMFLAALGSLGGIVAASVLIGFGYGLTNPASSHLLDRCASPHNRNLVFSIKQTGVPLGGIAAGLVGPPLAVAFSWTVAVAATGAAALALAAALGLARARWDSDRDATLPLRRAPLEDLRLIWHSPVLRPLSLSALCFAATQLCLTSFLVALLVEDLRMGLVEAGALLSIVQAAGFAGRVFWGWFADRIEDGLRVLVGIAAVSAAGAIGTTLLTPATTSTLATTILVVFGFAAIGWNGVYLAEVARASPSDRIGSTTGGSLVFTFAGVLLGPPLFALAHGVVGSFTATFGLLTVVPITGLMFVAFARRHGGAPSRLRSP